MRQRVGDEYVVVVLEQRRFGLAPQGLLPRPRPHAVAPQDRAKQLANEWRERRETHSCPVPTPRRLAPKVSRTRVPVPRSFGVPERRHRVIAVGALTPRPELPRTCGQGRPSRRGVLRYLKGLSAGPPR